MGRRGSVRQRRASMSDVVETLGLELPRPGAPFAQRGTGCLRSLHEVRRSIAPCWRRTSSAWASASSRSSRVLLGDPTAVDGCGAIRRSDDLTSRFPAHAQVDAA